MKKIGILELCGSKATDLSDHIHGLLERKQNVSVTPQAISVWCRQMGHQVHYAAYFGIGDPKDKLPNDLDIVFISSHSYLAPLAYALSKVYRMEGVLTVIGGAHAKSFPRDALRYFDLVVLDCDKALLTDIIGGHFEPHSIISSPKPYDDTPTIEERMPEIRASSFWRGKPYPNTFIPLLASIGCPYTCNFCVDWNTRYRALSSERLIEDLRYTSENLPGVKLFFDDPNFGIRFDEVLDLFDTVPAARRNPYIMESSLTNLRNRERLMRLRETNCLAVGPGIESWNQYSNKAAVGTATNQDKLDQVVEHFQTIHEYVPYIQANFILGLDQDAGDEPFELTKEFLRRTPFVFPTLNIPVAYGGTPLYLSLLKEGRILKTMPFTFYWLPYLTLILKNYDAISYFEKMVDLYAVCVSNRILMMRLTAKTPGFVKAVHYYHTFVYRGIGKNLETILNRLRSDSQFRAFHAGETDRLPDFYVSAYKRQLDKYAELMPIEESQPLLDDEAVIPQGFSPIEV